MPAIAAAVLLLHGLVLVFVGTDGPRPRLAPAEPAPHVRLRLDVVPAATTAAPAGGESSAARPRATAGRLRPRAAVAAVAPGVEPAAAPLAAPALDSRAAPAIASRQAGPPSLAPPPGPAPAAVTGPGDAPTLDLRLPAPGARAAATAVERTRRQALEDPRANSDRDPLRRLGLAIGGVALRTEEQLADGTIRIRQGTSCVLAHPARSAGLDPYNTAILPVPRHVEPC